MLPILPNYNPSIVQHQFCSFFVIGEMTTGDGRQHLSSGVASSAVDVPEAICKAILGFPQVLSQGDLAMIEVVCQHLEEPSSWSVSDSTGLPVLSTVGLNGELEDGTKIEIIVRVMALLDGREDEQLPAQSSGLITAIVEHATAEYAVPFAGYIDAMTWPAIVNAVLSSDRASITRLRPEPANEIGGFITEAVTNGDDVVACAASYAVDPESEEANEIVSMFNTFEKRNIYRKGEILCISVEGTKDDIASALDWTSERLVGLRTAGVTAE